MADHAEVEYATAAGNDYIEHEAMYRRFLHLTVVLIIHVINILLALAIGGVMGHWLPNALVVFIVAVGAAAHGVISGSKASSYAALAVSLVVFVLSAG